MSFSTVAYCGFCVKVLSKCDLQNSLRIRFFVSKKPGKVKGIQNHFQSFLWRSAVVISRRREPLTFVPKIEYKTTREFISQEIKSM